MNEGSAVGRDSRWKAFRDGGLILLVLVAANAVFQRHDPGWVRHAPSPYLFVPLLLGGRYGLVPGVIGGLVTGVLLSGSYAVQMEVSFQEAWRHSIYQILLFAGVGVVTGEIQGYFQRQIDRDRLRLEIASLRLRELDGELTILRESKDRADRLLAIRDSETAGLDLELRKLFVNDAQDLYQNLLFLLNRTLRVTDAALYQVTESRSLRREALLGSEKGLPESMGADSHPMIDLAIKKKEIISLPEFWRGKQEGASSDYLLVSPLIDQEENIFALILVTGIPFVAMQKRTVMTLRLIGNWVARVLEGKAGDRRHFRFAGRDGSKKIHHLSYFKKSFALALEAQKTHSLPSSVVVFSLPAGSPASREEFENTVLDTMRAGDICACAEYDFPHLIFLLFLTGENGAEIFTQRITDYCGKRVPWGKEIQSQRFAISEGLEEERLFQRISPESVGVFGR